MLASSLAPVFGCAFNKVWINDNQHGQKALLELLLDSPCSSACSASFPVQRSSSQKEVQWGDDGGFTACFLQYMKKLQAVHEGGQRTARTTKSLPKNICQESPRR